MEPVTEPRWKSPHISWRGGNVDIPEHTHRALVAYIETGEDSYDDFFDAVLENNLRGAVHEADDVNLPMIPHIVAWIYNYAPAGCQGSARIVEQWKRQGGLEGLTKGRREI